jgi:AbrB family looped-hinge helix DNA binding protein
MLSKITAKGQTTVPAEVRERLGAGPGDHLRYDPLPDGRIVVSKADMSFKSLRGILKSDVRLTDEELQEAIEETWGARWLGLDRD